MTNTLHPKRHLNIEGAYNVRDIGGYPTHDGRRTRWKRFLRADNLHRLSPASQTFLIEYGLSTVIDLRQIRETQETPNVFAGSSDVVYRNHNMIGDTLPVGYPAEGEGAKRISSNYRVFLDGRHPQICQILTTLAVPGAVPAVYHCASGKDRTGLISALLLGLAGVPEDIIAADYALSARYLIVRYLTEFPPPEQSASDYTWEDYQAEFCPPEAMLMTLEHLTQRYGGIDEYVRSIGLAPDAIGRLRAELLE